MSGANGVWKFGGNLKPTVSAKSFVRKNSDPFTNSLSRTSSINDKHLTVLNSDVDSDKLVGTLGFWYLLWICLVEPKE